MKFLDFRHLTILALSAAGLVLSVIFLSPKSLTTDKSSSINMAILEDAKNKIIRQRVNSIAWETIQTGELLSLGEKIKTDDSSNATIKFLKTNTKINLTKNSTIVIEDNGQNFKLRLLEGNLYVTNKSSDIKDNLEIITGKDGIESVKLNNAEATISVAENGKAELNIIKGTVEASKSIKISDSSFFGVLYPNYGEIIYLENNSPYSLINLVNKELALIPLQNFIKENYNYSINISNAENEAGETYQINNNLMIPLVNNRSNYYWKIIAKKNNSDEVIEGPTMKFFINTIEAPGLQFPVNNDTIRFVDSQSFKAEFKWTLPTPLDQIEIEIAKDENFAEIITKEKVSIKTYFETDLITEEGRYFWKIKGKLKNQNDKFKTGITSNTFSFNLKKGLKLNTPTIISPSMKQVYYYEEGKDSKDIVLSWSDIKESNAYSILLKNEGFSKNIESKNNFYELKNLKAGKYIWSIKASNQKDVDSDYSDSLEFTILPSLEIKITGQIPLIHYYTDKIKSIPIEWSAIDGAKSYEIITTRFGLVENSDITSTQINKGLINFKDLSQLEIQIIAKNNFNEIIARSKNFKITPTLIPIPSAPLINSGERSLFADNNGNITIILNTTENNYPELKYTLTNQQNFTKVIKTLNGKTSSIILSNLMPGKYKFSAYYIDAQSRNGHQSAELEIIVKNESNIMAPKIKKVNIK